MKTINDVIAAHRVPDGHIRGHVRGILLAIEHQVTKPHQPGSFVTAVICNDLLGAVTRADSINRRWLHVYALFVSNDLPLDKVRAFRRRFGKRDDHAGVPTTVPTTPTAKPATSQPAQASPGEPDLSVVSYIEKAQKPLKDE